MCRAFSCYLQEKSFDKNYIAQLGVEDQPLTCSGLVNSFIGPLQSWAVKRGYTQDFVYQLAEQIVEMGTSLNAMGFLRFVNS